MLTCISYHAALILVLIRTHTMPQCSLTPHAYNYRVSLSVELRYNNYYNYARALLNSYM